MNRRLTACCGNYTSDGIRFGLHCLEIWVDHARLFVDWLQGLDGFAGQLVVVSVLTRLYEGFCQESNLRAFNWRRVAAEIRKVTGDKKRYGKVSSGNGTRRERIYRIPCGPVIGTGLGTERHGTIGDQ